MSADPDVPIDPNRYSGGHVIRNMIYQHRGGAGAGNLEIITGWSEQGVREANQEVVPPAKLNFDDRHPCSALNRKLLMCSSQCPQEMRLAGRVATCNEDRKALMQCLSSHRSWKPEAQREARKKWFGIW